MVPVPAVNPDGSWSPALAALRGRDVSGSYLIFDRGSGSLLYVGESHSGRLFDTLTRHFRRWRRGDRGGERRGGTMYNRERVLVAWVETDPSAAQAAQWDLIQGLRPADNLVEGSSIPI